MTTPAQRARARAEYLAARMRQENAEARGDRAGALISASAARLILARMIAATEADVMERADGRVTA